MIQFIHPCSRYLPMSRARGNTSDRGRVSGRAGSAARRGSDCLTIAKGLLFRGKRRDLMVPIQAPRCCTLGLKSSEGDVRDGNVCSVLFPERGDGPGSDRPCENAPSTVYSLHWRCFSSLASPDEPQTAISLKPLRSFSVNDGHKPKYLWT